MNGNAIGVTITLTVIEGEIHENTVTQRTRTYHYDCADQANRDFETLTLASDELRSGRERRQRER